MTDRTAILDDLFAVIESRKGADPDTSYTASLFAKGRNKIAQKVGEESVETILAATTETKADLVNESADLLYHLLVLWADSGVVPEDVWQTLAKRFGLSGIDEKSSRNQS